jgi:hypothetical protein
MLSNNVAVQKIENADDLRAELRRLGADLSASNHLVPALKVQGVVPKLARFVYQEMTLEGGWVILPAQMDDRSAQPVALLIGGTPRQMQHLIVRLRTQNVDELNELADALERTLRADEVEDKQ